MAIETKTILRVGTEEAVKSVGELRENIKELKKQLDGWKEKTDEVDESGKRIIKTHEGLVIGTEEYQKALRELKENQNALKDAMYATSSSMDDVAAAAKGIGIEYDSQNKLINAQTISYNALVHEMAKLKESWRATTDESDRAKIGEKINSINDRLKTLDKTIGNHQRNVGNYTSALDGLGDVLKSVGVEAEGVINPVKNVTAGLKTLSATPVIGILGLLVTTLQSVNANLSTSAENADRVAKAFSIFGSAGDAVTKVMQTLGKGVAFVAEQMASLYEKFFGLTDAMKMRQDIAEKSIELQKAETAAIREDADAQLELAQLNEKINDKQTYSQKERIEFLKQANAIEQQIARRNIENARTEYQIIKERNSLTESSAEDLRKEAEAYAKMKNASTEYFNKMASNQKKLNTLLRETGDTAKSVVKEVQEEVDKFTFDDFEKALVIANKKFDEELRERQEIQEFTDGILLEMEQETTDAIDEMWRAMHEAELQRMEEEQQKAEQLAQARIDTMFAVANATSSIFSSIADIYEADAQNSQKSANKVKALRVASATIDTISGALGAFTQATETIPPPYGQIVGTANAAAVTATGMAQIAKIKSTQISTSGGGSSSIGASVVAPSVGTEISQVRNVTSASEEDRFNKMSSDQRVVLVMSDLETKQDQIKVQVEESSF